MSDSSDSTEFYDTTDKFASPLTVTMSKKEGAITRSKSREGEIKLSQPKSPTKRTTATAPDPVNVALPTDTDNDSDQMDDAPSHQQIAERLAQYEAVRKDFKNILDKRCPNCRKALMDKIIAIINDK